MKPLDYLKSLGLIFIGAISAALFIPRTMQAAPKQYVYDVNVTLYGNTYWQYIQSEWYKITLLSGDSIKIRLNITTPNPLDVVELRFYHICNLLQDEAIGKFYTYVNGLPALPTIGTIQSPIPMYLGLPKCPAYGTVDTSVWDTDDTRMPGLVEYTYVYEGTVPMTFKTLELYVTRKG